MHAQKRWWGWWSLLVSGGADDSISQPNRVDGCALALASLGANWCHYYYYYYYSILRAFLSAPVLFESSWCMCVCACVCGRCGVNAEKYIVINALLCLCTRVGWHDSTKIGTVMQQHTLHNTGDALLWIISLIHIAENKVLHFIIRKKAIKWCFVDVLICCTSWVFLLFVCSHHNSTESETQKRVSHKTNRISSPFCIQMILNSLRVFLFSFFYHETPSSRHAINSAVDSKYLSKT